MSFGGDGVGGVRWGVEQATESIELVVSLTTRTYYATTTETNMPPPPPPLPTPRPPFIPPGAVTSPRIHWGPTRVAQGETGCTEPLCYEHDDHHDDHEHHVVVIVVVVVVLVAP